MAAEARPLYEFTYILDGVLAEDQIKDLVGRRCDDGAVVSCS